jgi:hypothetical protein
MIKVRKFSIWDLKKKIPALDAENTMNLSQLKDKDTRYSGLVESYSCMFNLTTHEEEKNVKVCYVFANATAVLCVC